jgi:hypothetical protein
MLHSLIRSFETGKVVHVYVIAASEDGPTKVGCGGNPRKRLASLQTGNPQPLSVFHVERTGYFSTSVEREVHQILASTRRPDGGKEWFEIRPAEAKIIVQVVAYAFMLSQDRTHTLHDLSWKPAQLWLRLQEEYRDYCDENDLEPSGDFANLDCACALKILAQSIFPDASVGLPFSDFLHSHNDGVLLHWAFGQLGERPPKEDRLAPYVRAYALLEERGMTGWDYYYVSRDPTIRWLEWNTARKLTANEVRCLIDLWNDYVDEHNTTMARRLPLPPRVRDGVYLKILGVEENGDPVTRLMFSRDEFRAIVKLPKGISLAKNGSVGWSYAVFDERLKRLRNVAADGFVSANITNEVLVSPILPWLESAAFTRDRKFKEFLKQPGDFFPAPYKWDGREQPFVIFEAMPRIGDHGEIR